MFKLRNKKEQTPRMDQNTDNLLEEYGLDINFTYPSREECKAELLPKINEFVNSGSNALDKDSEADFLMGEIRDYIEENLKDLSKQRYEIAMRINKTNIKNDRAMDRCQEEMDAIKKEIEYYEKKKSEKGFFSGLFSGLFSSKEKKD